MSATDPNLSNRPPPPPDLRTLLLALRREIMVDINCLLPGTINSWNKDKQTASVAISLQRQVGGQTVAYPLLTDVPVVMLGGGAAYLSFPIAVGDTCLVFFGDRDASQWLTTGSTGSVPSSPRLHSLSDGFALVGVRTATNPISGVSATSAQLINGTSGIKVDAKIGVFNASGSLLTALNDCVAALTALNAKTGPDASVAIATFQAAVTALLQ